MYLPKPLALLVLTLAAISLLLLFTAQAKPQSVPISSAASFIDYSGFQRLSQEVWGHRASNMVDLETFIKMAEDPNTIILDTRSKEAFDAVHWKGAVHLNFSDFTEEKLEKVIPSKETRILIYCNNNIDSPLEALADKSLPLALNIPTYINLFGYGYQNVYELATRVADARLAEQLEGEAFDPAAYPPFDDPE